MMESGVFLMRLMVLLVIVTRVVQDVRIASIWTKRDRITTDGSGVGERMRDSRTATRHKRTKKCIA
ncbi:hypothetical protein CORC01_09635 [Colletotrichum orchidophilum]|uniref:Secreted protein n=1 Tax=Colletotrichum orchidophilum TaxID=1209926 RepID=A0A1G4B152_9PEZI|nr:uncharacterized protein CORC01_09635 [Colletotrichum orchidophilum]OHE95111.1 hypothetical protein CORC01_09635 [Colletotrichum orchidophilum]